MMRSFLAFAITSLVAFAAQATVVTNPVPAPIARGLTVGLNLFGQAPHTNLSPSVARRTLLQSVQPVGDASGRLFMHDTRGLISVVGAGGGNGQPWLDIRALQPGFLVTAPVSVTGLMGFTLHPNFAGDPARPGYATLYTISTTSPLGTAMLGGNGTGVAHENVLMEIRVADPAAGTASVVSQREVMRLAQPTHDHGPGKIGFNPNAAPGTADYGNLYLAMGDGSTAGDPFNNGQDLTSAFGKILRINPAQQDNGAAYAIPADNPFAGDDGALDEIWAYGFRNPQHFSWDEASGQMLITDIGQSQLEEVNVGVAGGNYGWPLREGTFARGDSTDPNVYDTPLNDGRFVDPVAQYDHEEIFRSGEYNLSAIGGAFTYAGSAVPELFGKTVLTDLVSGRVFYFDQPLLPGEPTATLFELGFQLDGVDATFRALEGTRFGGRRVDLRLGTDANNELYLFSKTNGNIYTMNSLLAVPEPGTWLLMIAGFGLIGTLRRRTRRTSAITSPRY